MEQEIPFAPSSNIQRIVYDPDTQQLTIAFQQGGTYRYSGVSEETARGFETARSAGSYHHSFIKQQHQFEKIG